MSLHVNPYLLGTIVVMVTYLLYRYLINTYRLLEDLGIPGPKPVWIFGNALDFKDKDVLKVFDHWKKLYGKVYGFYEGFRAGIVINDPDLAKEILSKHFDNFHTRTSYRPFQYYPCNLQLINLDDGTYWKRQRGLMNRTLNVTGTLKQAIKKVQLSAVKLIKTLEERRQACVEGFNISPLVDRFTTDAVMRVVLNMTEDDITQYGDTIFRYEIVSNLSASAENQLAGLARLFPKLTPLLQLSDKEHKLYHEKVTHILSEYLEKEMATKNNNKTKDAEQQSLLAHLITSKILTRDIDGSLTRRDLTHDEILAHVLALVSETFMTMTSAIQYLLYELALNQKCQEKLYEEVCRTIGKDSEIKLSALNEMEYFEQLFSETYRLHPIAPGVTRVCADDITVQGIKFKKDMPVRIMASTMYSDESVFPNPEKFDPERFSRESRDQRHQFLFMPFGMGPRMCPGQKLAMLELKTVFVHLLSQYKVEACSETEVPLKNALRPSLCPANGVQIKLVQRDVISSS